MRVVKSLQFCPESFRVMLEFTDYKWGKSFLVFVLIWCSCGTKADIFELSRATANRQVSYSPRALRRARLRGQCGSTSLQKQKRNIGNLPLSRWKTIEILKIVRFQSLNFTSKSKGYLLQTTKLWEKLIVLNRSREKMDEGKRRTEVNF